MPNLLSICDLQKSEIESIIDRSIGYRASSLRERVAHAPIAATLFFEASTRTRFSFEAAALKIGAGIISLGNPLLTRSGSSWGESYFDLMRMLNGYVDIVIMRHSEVDPIHNMADVATIPLINGGNGIGEKSEHPTQALVDATTIYHKFGRLNNITILLVGGLHQRATNSLLKLLDMFDGVTIFAMCPEEYLRNSPLSEDGSFKKIDIRLVHEMEPHISNVDVVYLNTMSETRSDIVPPSFCLTPEKLSTASHHTIVLHPLPRGEELPKEIDHDPRSCYFEQAANGVPVRMALLKHFLAA